MKAFEYFNYKNDTFKKLEEPIAGVMSAFGNAEKWFAAIKDIVLVEMGMPFLSHYIHNLEHVQPERVDDFAEIPHSYGLLLPYPGTPELAEDFSNDLDRVFEVCVYIVDAVDSALNGFITACKDGKFNALALNAEEIQLQNNADRTLLIEAWKMWDNGNMSRSSFDSWCKHLFEGGAE